MSRFYIKPDNVRNDKIYVDGEEARHILNVMRLKRGDGVIAFDGTGREYFGDIESISTNSLIVKIKKIEEHKTKKRYRMTLAQAIPKKAKMDYIIQKATELGIDSIIPMNTERTVVKLSKSDISARQNRWERIAKEAAKQCGRSEITKIEGYLDFEDVLENVKSYDLALMPSIMPVNRQSLKKCLSNFKGESILIFIGPEGGFDPAELDAAFEKGVIFVSLGENVLKSDTAAIAAIAMINYALSNGDQRG